MGELGDKLTVAVTPLLEDGVGLEGACVATHVGLF